MLHTWTAYHHCRCPRDRARWWHHQGSSARSLRFSPWIRCTQGRRCRCRVTSARSFRRRRLTRRLREAHQRRRECTARGAQHQFAEQLAPGHFHWFLIICVWTFLCHFEALVMLRQLFRHSARGALVSACCFWTTVASASSCSCGHPCAQIRPHWCQTGWLQD